MLTTKNFMLALTIIMKALRQGSKETKFIVTWHNKQSCSSSSSRNTYYNCSPMPLLLPLPIEFSEDATFLFSHQSEKKTETDNHSPPTVWHCCYRRLRHRYNPLMTSVSASTSSFASLFLFFEWLTRWPPTPPLPTDDTRQGPTE